MVNIVWEFYGVKFWCAGIGQGVVLSWIVSVFLEPWSALNCQDDFLCLMGFCCLGGWDLEGWSLYLFGGLLNGCFMTGQTDDYRFGLLQYVWCPRCVWLEACICLGARYVCPGILI